MRIYEIPSRKEMFDIVAKFYQKQDGNSENKVIEKAFSSFLANVYPSDEFNKIFFDYDAEDSDLVLNHIVSLL